MSKWTSALSKVGFWTKRKSPELLVAASIIAAAGSIILAIKATPKAEILLQNSNRSIKAIKTDMADEDKRANGQYSIQEGKKALTKVYTKTALGLGKLYLPTVIGFGLTVSGILGSHKIMKSRNVALAAAYTTLENGYRSYRNRVASKFGEKVEGDIFRNVFTEKKEVTEIDENGNEVTTVKDVTGPHVQVDSDFTVIWGPSAKEHIRNTDMNLNLLALKEKYLNQYLVSAGAVFLYEVYEHLGIDISTLGAQKMQAARVLGWIYDPEDKSRDSYISFGLFDKFGNRNEYAMEALRNNDQEIFLEFNVDGDILTGKDGNRAFMDKRTVI